MANLKVTGNIESTEGTIKCSIMPQVNNTAIVESGSNAQGYYTKFADGILVCRGSFVKDTNVTVTLPHHFANIDYSVVCQHASGVMRGNYTNTGDVRSKTTSSFKFNANHSEKDDYDYIAIGSWK